MPSLPPPPESGATRSRIRAAFRVAAVVEAVTWAGLLVGMLLEHVLHVTDLGVYVFGRLHGAAFLAYGVTTLLTWWVQRWTLLVGLVALGSSIPPCATLAFEVWAQRRGHLDDRQAPTPQVSAQPTA